MTKDFNKQRRNDDQPSFRNTSSRRYGEEGLTRPRLNREMVDRAWENGAQRIHADYHPRTTGNAPRNNWRNNQNTNRSSGNSQQPSRGPRNQRPQQDSYGRNSYQRPGSNNENHQSRSHFGAPQRDNYTPRRPYGARDIDEQQSRPQSYNQRGPRNGGYQTDGYAQSRPAQRPERAPYSQQGNPNRRYDRDRDGGYAEPRGRFNNNNSNSNNNKQHDNEWRQGSPARSSGQRPQTGNRNTPPHAQRSYGPPYRNERRDTNERQPGERFKGDYEQFTNDTPPTRPYGQTGRDRRTGHPGGAPRTNSQYRQQSTERHVTPLSDGRVLKGSRPEQRKAERFWTGVNDETEQLVRTEHAEPRTEHAEPRAEHADTRAETQRPQVVPFRRHIASASAEAETNEPQKQRRSKSASLGRRTKIKKPVANGPRPSQRGFKWPTQS